LVSSTISVVTTKDLRRAGFPFRSGSLCLDFVATVAKRGMGDRELLEGPAELAIWLHVAGLPEVDGPVSEADMTGVWELRETLHGMTRARVAGKRLSRLAVAMVNAAALAGPPPSLLAPDGESVRPPAAAPLASVISIVARDAVELFGGQYGHRIRACLGHDCSLYFVDRSRPGSRRWCAMAACGEKASSATYRQRHTPGPATRER